MAFYQINRMNRQLHLITANSLPAVYSLGKAEGFLKDIRGKMRSFIVAEQADEKRQNEIQLAELERELALEMANYDKFLRDDHERELFSNFSPLTNRWKACGVIRSARLVRIRHARMKP